MEGEVPTRKTWHFLRAPLWLFSISAVLTASAPSLWASDEYSEYFTNNTLRFDYYHSGTAEQEEISLDQFRLEREWPGARGRLLDDTNLGKYLFEVVDQETNLPIYSRGFSSIYGEWETTGEANKGIWRTFHESQRFPEPLRSSRIVLKKRGREGNFHEIYSTPLEPQSRFVDRSSAIEKHDIWRLFENGVTSEKVDLLILGDGYRSNELGEFRADVKRLVKELFSEEPFKSRRSDFNVRAIDIPSPDTDIDDPRGGEWKANPLELSFNAFDLDRYVLTYANKKIREIAAQAPYDTLVMIFNSRKYGGGGIFNLWATSAADTKPSAYVFVHEFGHSFAGLGDEYYSSQVAYESFNTPGVEPWEPNITALLDPDRLKWQDLVEEGTPLPTPWNQEEYDRAAANYSKLRQELSEKGASDIEVDALFDRTAEILEPLMEKEQYAKRVGAFEGASYQAKGLYRPSVDCIMFSRNAKEFCPVCRAAIEGIIDLHIGK